MVEEAIQQGLMFDVSEEHWEALEECDGMLATREEKIYNLISDPIEGQRKAQVHLEHDRLIKSSVRYINPRLADWLKGELKKMEEIGVIQKSYSPYTSPITIVEVLRLDGK